MNIIIKRSITGLVFVIILLGSITFSSITFVLLFLLIIIIGMLEFYNLFSKNNIKPQKYMGIFTGIALFLCNFFYAANYVEFNIFLILIPLLILIFIIELYRKTQNPFSNISNTFLGLIYIALPFSLLNYFTFSSFTGDVYNPDILIGFFILLWFNDIAAFLFGITLGKHKLFERISPKKSWEGCIGGAVITIIVAYLISFYFVELTFVNWLIIAAIIIIIGTFGDLVESLFKRSINIKDSGSILPGHGGILDRFDSVLLSSPVVFCYLQLINIF